MSELEGRIALVTGGSRGIGKAVAGALVEAGARVGATSTSERGAAEISDALGESGQGFVMDVADADSIDAGLAAVGDSLGTPTILVNNAGIARDQLLLRMKDADWEAIMNTNLTSVFRLSKACLRGMMKARWGRIVNVGSVIGALGNAGQANYAAAKAGLVGFTRSLAREVGSRGITANVVAPGFVETDMTAGLSDDQRSGLLADIPLASLGQVDDIAAAVTFLVSPGARYITGHTLHVNGGMYMG